MKQRGFSLIELSIVLVIIGLMVGGVIGGRALVRQAELNKIISLANSYKVAFNTFTLQYNAMPGDFNEASQYWTGAQNGNGNGSIGVFSNEAGWLGKESLYFWRHLALAELITGTFTGEYYPASDPLLRFVPAVNMPDVKFDNAKLSFWVTSEGSVYDKKFTRVEFSATHGLEGSSDNSQDMAILLPKDTKSLDSKMDDGLATSGKVMAYDAYDGTGNCTTDTGDFSSGSGNYILSTTTKECALIFVMQ